MSKSKDLPVVITLLLFSFLLRLTLMSKGPYSSDCLSITIQAERFLDTHTLHYHFGFGYPLTIIIAAFFVCFGRLFDLPDAVLAVNFMSVVFGSLCIPLFYYLVKNLLDKTTALLSAVLLSLCPIFLGVSVYGIGHTPAMVFLFLGLLSLFRYFSEGQRLYLLLSGLSFGFSGAARVQDMIIFLPALTTFFFLARHIVPQARVPAVPMQIRHFLILISICLLTILVFHLPYLIGSSRSAYIAQLGNFQQLSIVSPNELNRIRFLFIHNYMYLTQSLSILGIILSSVGLVVLSKERFYLFIFLMTWILIPLLLFSQLHGLVARHQILILPPLILSQCFLLAKLIPFGNIFRLTSLFVYSLLIILTFGHYLPYFVYRHQHSAIKEYCVWLNQVTEPNALIIGTDIGAFIERYARRKPMGRMMSDRYLYSDLQLNDFKKELDAQLDQGIPVYITDTGLFVYDLRQRFSNFIKANFELEYVGWSIYEDWHRDYLQFKVIRNALYRIKKK